MSTNPIPPLEPDPAADPNPDPVTDPDLDPSRSPSDDPDYATPDVATRPDDDSPLTQPAPGPDDPDEQLPG
jgi:hypothetical protein